MAVEGRGSAGGGGRESRKEQKLLLGCPFYLGRAPLQPDFFWMLPHVLPVVKIWVTVFFFFFFNYFNNQEFFQVV